MRIILESVYKERGGAGIRILYEFLRERLREPDTNISHHVLPAYRQHSKFVRSIPYRIWYFIKVDGLVAGTCHLTPINEIGIFLSADYRRKGIGKQALRMMISRHKPLPAIPSHRVGKFIANINPKNEPSIRLFTGLEFKHIINTYQL